MTTDFLVGAEKHSGPTPNAQTQNAKKPNAKKDGARATLAATPTGTAAAGSSFLVPPQGPGGPRRLFGAGGPASQERLNVAMRVLRDPVARASFSRVYSGQSRNWNR
jgi:hypothetical protein